MGSIPELHPAATPLDGRTDPDTSALSRAGFGSALVAALAPDGTAPWTVVSCDLNNFRYVNEFVGFRQGTDLLRTVAGRLQAAVPHGALVGRSGADHFLVALPPQQDVRRPAELIAGLDDALRQPVDLGGETVCPSATFGLARNDDRPGDIESTADALIVAADRDLRQNRDRRDGRQHASGSLAGLRLDAALHAAIAGEQITAAFQPLYDLRSGDLYGFEALARWTTPDGTSIPPGVFVPMAEENGLITALGDHMLQEVERLLEQYGDEPELIVQVNVSPTELASPEYARRFVDRFSRDPTVLSRITVEVTESPRMVDREIAVAQLQALRDVGVGVALDDFGSGYSTLLQLQTIPATLMKIDKGFVQQGQAAGTAVLEAMIGLARASGLRVVAEGVETIDQLRMVQRLGCDVVQGFLFSRAVAPDALARAPRTIVTMLAAA